MAITDQDRLSHAYRLGSLLQAVRGALIGLESVSTVAQEDALRELRAAVAREEDAAGRSLDRTLDRVRDGLIITPETPTRGPRFTVTDGERHPAYQAALDADDAYHAELVRVYGESKAGDARYGTHTDAACNAAKRAKIAADDAWRKAQNADSATGR